MESSTTMKPTPMDANVYPTSPLSYEAILRLCHDSAVTDFQTLDESATRADIEHNDHYECGFHSTSICGMRNSTHDSISDERLDNSKIQQPKGNLKTNSPKILKFP